MPRSLQTLALLFTLLTFAAAAPAKDDGHDKDRAAIKAAYAAYDKAVNSKDVDGMEAFDADPTPHNRANAQMMCSGALTLTSHTIVERIQFTKAGANVVTKDFIKATVLRHGTPHTSSLVGKSRDELIKSNGTWKQADSAVIDSSFLMDGKPVP